MIFFSGFTNYMMLSSISVSIVQMVGQPTMVSIPACKRLKGGTTTKEINRTVSKPPTRPSTNSAVSKQPTESTTGPRAKNPTSWGATSGAT